MQFGRDLSDTTKVHVVCRYKQRNIAKHHLLHLYTIFETDYAPCPNGHTQCPQSVAMP